PIPTDTSLVPAACHTTIDNVAFDPATFTCTIVATQPNDVVCGLTFAPNVAPIPCTFDSTRSYKWDKTQTATALYIRRFQCADAAAAPTIRPFREAFTDPKHPSGQPYFYAVGLFNRPGTACYLNWAQGRFAPVTQQSPVPPAALRDYFRGNPNRKQVVLTFDAHTTPFTTDDKLQAVLDILQRAQVPATFFVTGQWAAVHGDALSRMIRAGFTVGNHTADHTSLRALVTNNDPLQAQQAVEDELLIGDRLIREQTGVTTLPYFRAPSVDYTQQVLQIAARLGYTHINYTLDPGDWKQPYPDAFGPITPTEVWNNIFQSGRLQPGAILLQHLDNPITPAILAAEIAELRARGYTIVPLAAGLQ
ncbi:MAG: polysaccharide deacetylase family protein, partial [Chloroflexota bacterium]|nr:polysaccharide deacetylase family protein [Chloroflexota bacterium]